MMLLRSLFCLLALAKLTYALDADPKSVSTNEGVQRLLQIGLDQAADVEEEVDVKTAEVESETPSVLRNKNFLRTDPKHESLLTMARKAPGNLVANMDIKERVKVLESVAGDLDDVAEKHLKSLDLSEQPHLADTVDIALQAVEDAKVPIADAIHFMRESANHIENRKNKTAEEKRKQTATTPYLHLERTKANPLSSKRRVLETEVTADGKVHYNKNHNQKQDASQGDQSWRQHYKPKSKIQHQFNSPRHQHAQKIQEAVLNGNHNFFSGMVDGLHARTSHFTRNRHRDLQATKPEHCEQLAKCASAMSLYDLFVYYFSDDINPSTGEVDDIVKGFDESNYNTDQMLQGIEYKRDQIQGIIYGTDGLFSGAGGTFAFSSSKCDDLLMLFHRSIEVNGNPQWEGAIVGQVCLAEGTPVFVQMNEALETLGMNYKDFEPSDNAQDDVNTFVDEFDDYVEGLFDILDPFVGEVLTCAKVLFTFLKDQSGSTEPFPFEDSSGVEVFPVSVNQANRDVHGRYTDVNAAAFNIKTYDDIRDQYRNCVSDEQGKQEYKDALSVCFNDFLSFYTNGFINTLLNCLAEVLSDIFKECLPVYGKEIQESVELVFGERASIGLICGISQAVVNDGRDMPGDCCLNAPYEGIDERWGYKYNCEGTCNHGPLLSGLSEESCAVYGGTFCPTTDCTDLRTCIKSEIEYAENNDLPTYKEYLSNSPNITDPFDIRICGRARQYFGFQSNFIDDDAVCEDIQQLRFSEDFEFLDEFFNQGDKVGPPPGDGNCPDPADTRSVECVPNVVLTPADRETSGNPPATNGQAWRATNFALRKAVETVFFILETIDAAKCPCDMFCISDNICKGIKTIIGTGLTILKFALELAFDISEFTYGEVAELGNVEPIEIYENTQVIFGNMEILGAWLQDRLEYLYQETTCRPVEQLLPGHGCDGIVNLCGEGERIPDECPEDMYPPLIELTRVKEMCGPEKNVFQDILAGVQCVRDHVIASDDCDLVTVSVSAGTGQGSAATCGELLPVSITATEQRCGKSTPASFNVLVDSAATGPCCKFSKGPQAPPDLDISAAIERCSGKIFFKDINDALTCIKTHASAGDDCRKVDLDAVSIDAVPVPSTCETYVHAVVVTARINGCALNTTKSMVVLVDENIATTTCTFTQGPEIDPIVDISGAVDQCAKKVFATVLEAEACVLNNTVARDGAGSCRPLVVTADTVVVDGCKHEVKVTAEVEGCDPLVEDLETVSDPIPVIIDNEPPVPACSFATAALAETGPGMLNDSGFGYTVTENCGTEVSVKIEGFSNELEQQTPFDKQHLVYRKVTTGGNKKIGLYVASAICHKTMTNDKCIRDPGAECVRAYFALVTATDQAGLTASAECRIDIQPKQCTNGNGNGNGNNNECCDQTLMGNPVTQQFPLFEFIDSEYAPDAPTAVN